MGSLGYTGLNGPLRGSAGMTPVVGGGKALWDGLVLDGNLDTVGGFPTEPPLPTGGGESGSADAAAVNTNQSGIAKLGTFFLLSSGLCKRLAIQHAPQSG
jgi:hypothetical protein